MKSNHRGLAGLFVGIGLVTGAAVLSPVFGAGALPEAGAGVRAKENIVEVARGAGKFGTLLKAAQAAGLVETLSGPGPLTVFAPTDEAFGELDQHALANLLKPEGRERLRAILTYHVVAGSVVQNDAVRVATSGGGVATVNGQRAVLSIRDGQLRVGEARVLKTDIEASNGVIHVIDKVLIPAREDLAERAGKAGKFKTLLAAAQAAGLAEALKGKEPLTVFAPTDAAFEALPKGLVAELLKPENTGTLKAILLNHVVAGRVYADQVLAKGALTTLGGASIRAGARDGRARVNDASIVSTDIDASNGVIHVIDGVLVPEGLKLPAVGGGSKGASSESGQGRIMLSGEVLSASDLIELAIRRGVPQFNDGNPSACAAIYEITIRAILSMPGGGTVPGEARTALQLGLEQASGKEDVGEQAWALRKALDSALAAIRDGKGR